jgi:hypothetical protein
VIVVEKVKNGGFIAYVPGQLTFGHGVTRDQAVAELEKKLKPAQLVDAMLKQRSAPNPRR